MNKIFKYSLMVFALASVMVSCTDEYEYDGPGKLVENDYGVEFSEQAVNRSIEFTSDEREYAIVLTRANTQGALTVPVTVNKAPSYLDVPSTVTFEDGSDVAELVITAKDDAEMFNTQSLSLSIPDEYAANPYEQVYARFVNFDAKVVVTDYRMVATGLFTDRISGAGTFKWYIEYSDKMGMYRFPSLYVDGYHFTFKWDGTTNADQLFYFCDSKGNKASSLETGMTYGSYGVISAVFLYGNFIGYDTDNAFYFPVYFKVKAGQLTNAGYVKFAVTEWLEKPWE
ncbi:MAG: hypothetical protein ACI4V5_06985 [Prevotella sp.]